MNNYNSEGLITSNTLVACMPLQYFLCVYLTVDVAYTPQEELGSSAPHTSMHDDEAYESGVDGEEDEDSDDGDMSDAGKCLGHIEVIGIHQDLYLIYEACLYYSSNVEKDLDLNLEE